MRVKVQPFLLWPEAMDGYAEKHNPEINDRKISAHLLTRYPLVFHLIATEGADASDSECQEPVHHRSKLSYDTGSSEPTITEREYPAFQKAYNFLNAELFAGSLPHVLVTFQRHANAKGYFAADRFEGRTNGAKVHELAINPDVFTDRSDKLILSTLAHEMAHVWQETYGTPPRRCYHDRQWAAKMKEIGLYPSTTGEVGGKETGQSVTHYIIPGGTLCPRFCKGCCNWLSAQLAVESAFGRTQEQNEIYLSHTRNQRMDQAADR